MKIQTAYQHAHAIHAEKLIRQTLISGTEPNIENLSRNDIKELIWALQQVIKRGEK